MATPKLYSLSDFLSSIYPIGSDESQSSIIYLHWETIEEISDFKLGVALSI